MPSVLRTLLPALVLPLAAPASEIFISNPGFEDIAGETPYFEFTFGPLPGWDLYEVGNTGFTSGGDGPDYYIGTLQPTVINPGAYEYFPDGAPEGSRVGIAFNTRASGGGGEYGMQQTLAASLQAGTTYTLQVRVGNIASGESLNGAQFALDGFPGYRIDLMAGGNVLASDNNSLAGLIPEGAFGLATVTFTTGATPDHLGENLGIRLVNLNVADPAFPLSDLEVDFDDVRLTAEAVPEPGTAALFLGSAGLFWLLPRRRLRP